MHYPFAIILISIFNLSHPMLPTIFLNRFYLKLKRCQQLICSMVNFPFSLLLMAFLKITFSGYWVTYSKSISVSFLTQIQAIRLFGGFFTRESIKKCKPPSYFWFCPWTFACYFHSIFCLSHRGGKQVTKTTFNQINQNYSSNITHHLDNSSKQLTYAYNPRACLCVKTELYESTHI